MKIYWTMNSVPELDGLDRREKRKLFREMFREGRKRIGVMPWVLFIAVAIGIAGVALYLDLGGVLQGAFIGAAVGLAFAILVQAPALDAGREWYRETQGRD